MNRSRILTALLLSSITLWSCRGCRQEEGPASILDLAPPDAMVVAYVPDSGELIQGLQGFVTKATKNAGTAAVGRIRESFKTQFGFDGFDPQAYAALGISGRGGALLFNEGSVKEPLLALAIAEPDVFEAKLREIIQKTDGPTVSPRPRSTVSGSSPPAGRLATRWCRRSIGPGSGAS